MTPTATDLEAAIRTVQASFDALLGSAMFVSGYFKVTIGPATDDAAKADLSAFPYVLQGALLTSFNVNARALTQFFAGHRSPSKARENDDVLAADFFPTPDRWNEDLAVSMALVEARRKIGKALAHLTYRWPDHSGDWNIRPVVAELVRLRDRFNALGPAHGIATTVKSLTWPYAPRTKGEQDG